jgi:HK97 family phage prohead protease
MPRRRRDEAEVDPRRSQLNWALKAKRAEAEDASTVRYIAELDRRIARDLAEAERLRASVSPGSSVDDVIATLNACEREFEVMRDVWAAQAELASIGSSDEVQALSFREAQQTPPPGAQVAGTFAGIASAYGVVADNGSGRPPVVILRGAFAEAVRDYSRVRLLRDHDTRRVVGTITALRDTDEGLWLEGAFARTPLGEETAELVRSQGLRELSVGFNIRRWTMGTRDGHSVRIVSDAELIEVSVVVWAANPGALIRYAAGRNFGGGHSSVLAEVEDFEREAARLLGGVVPGPSRTTKPATAGGDPVDPTGALRRLAAIRVELVAHAEAEDPLTRAAAAMHRAKATR